MDETKYEKIDGREALRRLVDGEEIFTGKGSKMRLDFENHQMVNGYGGVVSFYPLHAVLLGNWYIPKPFDVRQAMRDKPDEWVGFYKDDDGISWKVGFEVDSFQAVAIPYGISTKLPLYKKYRELGNWSTVTKEELEKCIPIEDGPEESKIYGMKPSVAICDEEATR